MVEKSMKKYNNNDYIYIGVQANYLIQRGCISPAPTFLTDIHKRYTMEQWKDIEGWEGFYQVSNQGRVKSLKRTITSIMHTGIVRKADHGGNNIKGWLDKATGYYRVCLSLNSKPTIVAIHRLVAIHFIPNPENKPQVNHIDGIKINNKLNNLEWVTSKENIQHAFATGLKTTQHTIGSRNSRATLNEEQVSEIKRLLREGASQGYLAKRYNVGEKSVIGPINQGRNWKHVK